MDQRYRRTVTASPPDRGGRHAIRPNHAHLEPGIGYSDLVKDAFRFLIRTPRFTVACALITALGVAMSTLLFAVIKATLIDPWPYDGAERIVTIRANYPDAGRERFALWSAPDVLDLARQTQVFDAVIAGVAEPLTVQQPGGEAEPVRAASLTPNAFAMLGVPAHLGRVLQREDARPGATAVGVVSDAFWRDRLGADPAIIGRILRVGSRQIAIVGVMPPAFRWWNREIWLPLRLDPSAPRTERSFYVQGRLRRGLTPAMAERELRTFAARLRDEHREVSDYAHLAVSLHTLLDDVLRDLRPALEVLLAAVLVVMLVAAANLSSVVLGRAASREGEFAVRLALGADRGRITRQLAAENVAIGATGAVLGIVLAIALLNPMLSLVPYGFIPAEAHVAIDWRVAASAAVVSLSMSLLSALVPAWRSTAVSPAIALRRNDVRTSTRTVARARYAFVLCQLAAAIALTTAGLAAVRALTGSIAHDPGFDTKNVWTARISEGEARAVERIVDVTRQRTNSDVAAISELPVGELPTALVSTPSRAGPTGAIPWETDVLAGSEGVERTLGFRIREGRAFRASDDGRSQRVALVTASLARRLWPDGALGRQFTIDLNGTSSIASIVGVIDDLDSRGDRQRRPLVILPLSQTPPAGTVVIAGRGPAIDGIAALRAAVRDVDAGIAVYETERLEQARRDALGSRIFAVVMLGAFCVAVVTLSIVGLHTLTGEIARERRRETAIRLALGARPRTLLLVDLRRAALLAAAAALIATPAIAAVPSLLGAVFTGIESTVRTAGVVSALCMGVMSIAAAAGPAWKSSRTTALTAR
jgi:predicted permease